MADDRRNGEEFEQIDNDRDRNDRSDNEEVINRDPDGEFEDADDLDKEDDQLSEGSE